MAQAKAKAKAEDEMIVPDGEMIVPEDLVTDCPPSADSADSISKEREARRALVLEAEFNPESLLGSWALYHAEAGKTLQALIVAEPQPGCYLCELYDVVSDEPEEQQIIDLARFGREVDDEGGSWRFFDDRESVRKAFRGLLA